MPRPTASALVPLLLAMGCVPPGHDHPAEPSPIDDCTPGAERTPCAMTVESGWLTGATTCDSPIPECPREGAALTRLRAFVGPDLPGLGAIWMAEMDGGVGGYADPGEDGTSWELVVIGTDPGAEEDHVLAHEYGHIATMRDLDYSAPPDDCDTLVLYGHCPAVGTVLRDFVDAFWVGEVLDIYRDVRTRYEELDPAGEQELRDRLGAAHLADQFVSEDARVDPAEDLAETYAALALDYMLDGGSAKVTWLRERLGDQAPTGE